MPYDSTPSNDRKTAPRVTTSEGSAGVVGPQRPAGAGDHYLRDELYRLVREDPKIFTFLEEGSLDGIWYWDLQAPDNEWMSPRFKAFFGYADHEITDSPDWWQNNIHPEDLRVAIDNFEKHKADPDHPYDQIVRYWHRDGSTVWVRCRGLIIRDTDGTPKRMLGAHTDVTELKRTQQALEAANAELAELNEELNRLNEQKDKFYGIIAHDLRAPFTALLGLSELLARGAAELEPVQVVEYASLVHRAADDGHKLLEDLLDWTRLQLGHMDYSPVSFDIEDLIQSNLRRFAPLAASKKVELRTTGRHDFPVYADSRMIDTVLRNLISNAIKFTPAGGGIVLETQHVNEAVELAVRDAGIGISGAQLKELFTLGAQSVRRGTDGETGTGLGLYLCQELIDRNAGKLTVESVVGRGSTFRVFLAPGRPTAG